MELNESIKKFIGAIQGRAAPDRDSLTELLQGTKYVEVLFEDGRIKKYIDMLLCQLNKGMISQIKD